MEIQDTERWRRLREIFDEAAELTGEARAVVVKARCGVDEELRRDLEQLLNTHDQADLALDRSPVSGQAVSGLLPPGKLAEGTILAGRFRIIRQLGEGGMGEVYEAEDTALGQRVALKTLHSLWAREKPAVERFKREILLARRISHPNVCRPFDFYSAEIPFLTMERLEGETIAQRIKRDGPLRPEEAEAILAQAARGLDAAHQQNILHRDIKPSNLMLCGDRVVVLDFGLARANEPASAESSVTAPNSAMGTPAYMSPEQLENRALTAASDVYSLGVVLFEMLTGHAPHAGLSPLAIAARRVQEPPPSPRALNPAVSERLDAVTRRCLAVAPVERPQDGGELLESLARPSSPARAGFYFSIRSVVLTVVGCLAFAAAAWLGWASMRTRPPVEAERWFTLGREALLNGSPHSASLLLQKALAADSQHREARVRLAEAYLLLDRPERAKDELIQADLKSGKWFSDRRVDAVVKAAKAWTVRDLRSAATFYGDAATQVRQQDKAGALVDQARAYIVDGGWKEAHEALESAVKSNPQLGAAWLLLGTARARLAMAPEAEQAFARADEVFGLSSNIEGLIAVSLQRSEAFVFNKALDPAYAELERALARARELKVASAEARVLFALSLVAQQKGLGDQSIDFAERGLRVSRQGGFEELSVRGILDLANAWSTQYRNREIAELVRGAIRQAELIRAPYLAARARVALAKAVGRTGDATHAEYEQLVDEAARYFRQGGFRTELLEALNWRLFADMAHGHYGEARKLANTVLAEAVTSGDELQAVIAGENLAEIDLCVGASEDAMRRYEEAAAAHEAKGRKQRAAYALVNAARAAVRGTNHAAAHQLLASAQVAVVALNQQRSSTDALLRLVSAQLALRESRFVEAARLAGMVANEGGSSLRRAQAQAVLGESLVFQGAVRDGLPLVERALSLATQEDQEQTIGVVSVHYLSSLVHAGLTNKARKFGNQLLERQKRLGHQVEQEQIHRLLARIEG